jgi:hypothetical protein
MVEKTVDRVARGTRQVSHPTDPPGRLERINARTSYVPMVRKYIVERVAGLANDMVLHNGCTKAFGASPVLTDVYFAVKSWPILSGSVESWMQAMREKMAQTGCGRCFS